MGVGAPYKLETCFCIKCFRFTEHRVYSDRQETQDKVEVYNRNTERYEYDHSIFHTYITTKKICTRCGESSSKTEHYKSEGCHIF